jgi:hypothetical protein
MRGGQLGKYDNCTSEKLARITVGCGNLDGIVAKRKDGPYTPEATTWVKMRNPHYSQMQGRHELFEKHLSASA